MTAPVPIRIDRPLMRMLLREQKNAALVFGSEHADALTKLLTVARSHGQEVDVALLEDGNGNGTVIARVAGSHGWACVK